MFRQTTAADGTTTITCTRCGTTRAFRSPTLLATWKRTHRCDQPEAA